MATSRRKFEIAGELELFEVRAGSDHYFVAAPEFMQGMEAVFHKYGAEKLEDLPKPFSYDRVKPDDKVLVVSKVKKEKPNGGKAGSSI